MAKVDFKDVRMLDRWKTLKHGDVGTIDVLAITQAMEFVAHAGEILKGECTGVPRNEASHLWDSVDKCKDAIETLGCVLDALSDDSLDAKLRRCLKFINARTPYHSATGPACRLAQRLAHGEANVDVSDVPERPDTDATSKLAARIDEAFYNATRLDSESYRTEKIIERLDEVLTELGVPREQRKTW